MSLRQKPSEEGGVRREGGGKGRDEGETESAWASGGGERRQQAPSAGMGQEWNPNAGSLRLAITK